MEDLEKWDYFNTVSLSNAAKTTMHGQDAISFSLSSKIERARAAGSSGGESGGGENK